MLSLPDGPTYFDSTACEYKITCTFNFLSFAISIFGANGRSHRVPLGTGGGYIYVCKNIAGIKIFEFEYSQRCQFLQRSKRYNRNSNKATILQRSERINEGTMEKFKKPLIKRVLIFGMGSQRVIIEIKSWNSNL